MRWGWIALFVVVACKKESAAPPATKQPVAIAGDAMTSDATASDAAPALVDLFRALPTSITVSSRVSNPKIKLEHLIDHDMNTAWNSRTGDLVGAWINIAPRGDRALARELRMTVGHTGKGPKGEDYFTMNPRITKVTVSAYGKTIGTYDLDVDKRELQTIPLPDLAGSFRVTIAGIKMGTKAQWREACVSELELWGTAPGATLPGTYTPIVGEVVPDSLEKMCDDVEPDPRDDSGLSNCELLQTTFDVDPPWGSPAVLSTVTGRVEHHGHVYSETIEQTLVFVVNGKAFLGSVLNNTGNSDDGTGSNKEFASTTTITEAMMVQVEKGNPPELAIRYRIDDAAPDADKPSFKDMVVVCATDGRCSDTFPVATQDWEINVRVVDDTIVRKKGSGSPPAKELGTTKLVLH